MLNKLFGKGKTGGKRGFAVGPTVNPCTKGLWLLEQPVYVEEESVQLGLSQNFTWSYEPGDGRFPVFVIDTEGLGAIDEDSNYDTKIFLLAILLCSLLVYNSVGAIDENAMNTLNLVINLTQTLRVRAGQSDSDELAEYFPGFMWVLRDFAL